MVDPAQAQSSPAAAVPSTPTIKIEPNPNVDSAALAANETADSMGTPSAIDSPIAVKMVTDSQATPLIIADPTMPVVSPQPNVNGQPDSILNLLIQQNLLSREQADQISFEKINSGKREENILEEKKWVAEEALTKAKAQFYNIPYVSLDEIGVSPEALTQLPEGVARRYLMLPFALDKQQNTLSVAMRDPLDLVAVDFAQQKTGLRIVPHYAAPSELERKIAERYAQNLSSEVKAALKDTGQDTEKKKMEDLSALSKEVIREAPISKIVETILAFAIKSRASDVHIEPQEDRTRVRYRIDGILTEKLILPRTVHDAVTSRIKILSDMKIDERRVPQDGRFNFTSNGETVDLRVSSLPTIHGEKIVMRLLRKNSSVPTLSDLGLRGFALRHVEEAIRVPHGIVLITGPTGSGKTTTLYSVLHKINTPGVNIVTLEDPVEYEITGVNQVQINPQAGLTFASVLRSFLRHDPNIIMVGEIRDAETVELAIQASLTGHLVFSTLHTSSAATAIPRMLDMGAEPFLLASSMTLTMGQRICRLINPDYKEEYRPEPAVVEDIKQVLGPLFDAWCKQNNKDPNNITLFRAKKDRPSTETEYEGRIGIFEVMRITEEIARLILERRPASDMEAVAKRDGMLLMKQDGYLKALEGYTTIEEVLRVAEV